MAAMLAGCGEKEAREQESAVEDLYEVDYAFTVDDFLKAASDGDAKAVHWFLEAGMEPDVENQQGERALLRTADAGAEEVLGILLDAGADSAFLDAKGRGALIYASGSGDVGAVKRVLDTGVDPGNKDSVGWSALTLATFKGHAKVVKLLAPLSREHADDALLIASLHGSTELIDILLANGGSVHARSKDRQTPLMYAAGGGHLDAVNLLLMREANRFALNNEEQTAAQIAAAAGHLEVTRVLNGPPAQGEVSGEKPDPLAVRDRDGTVLSRDPHQKGRAPLAGAQIVAPSWRGEKSMGMREYRERQIPVVLNHVQMSEEAGNTANVRLLYGSNTDVDVPLGEEIPGAGFRVVDVRQRFRETKEGPVSIAQMTVEELDSGRRHEMTGGETVRSSATFALMEFDGTEGMFEARRGDRFTALVGQGDADELDLRILDVRPTQVVVEDLGSGEVYTVPRY